MRRSQFSPLAEEKCERQEGATRVSGVPERPSMTPSSAGVSERMSRVRRRDTAPELELRSELHRRGLRYRIDRRPLKGVPSRADLVFGPAKVAVYVDGCFWHSCPEHGTMPRSNEAFWQAKLGRNQERDPAVNKAPADARLTP